MNDQIYPSAQAMIKIDGARIKAIREAKGLTQLYVATVVEVTTDTVSRWENRRYPTIKKENGLKLAQALEVELEDILDTGEGQHTDGVADAAGPAPLPAGEAERAGPQPFEPPAGESQHRRIGHLSMIIAAIVIIAGGIYAFTAIRQRSAPADIAAARVVPPHFIAGLPLPVFIHVEKTDDRPVSIILKEDLPPGTRLESAFPALSGESGGEIKWLTKITRPSVFFYTLVTAPSFSGDLSFSGTVKNNTGDLEAAIGGGRKTASGSHHWADRDGDNRISDAEILTVYDLLPGDAGQIIDLDQLEEMWLGDGYVWNPDQQQITIID